jgi:hypothetical protein
MTVTAGCRGPNGELQPVTPRGARVGEGASRGRRERARRVVD